jgi:hypothetical protein
MKEEGWSWRVGDEKGERRKKEEEHTNNTP